MLTYEMVRGDWEAALKASHDAEWSVNEREALAVIALGNHPFRSHGLGGRIYIVGPVGFLFTDAATGVNIALLTH